MTYTLFGSKRSGSLAVEIALAEIGASYEVRDIDLNIDAQRQQSFAAINPQRKIPVLQTPTGETLTESVAILLTLDERHPQAQLMPPAGSPDRARALCTLLFIATELYPIVEINDYPERFSPTAGDTDAVQAIARATWRERWLLVEQRIEGEHYLLECGFCLADIYIAVVSRWAQQDEWRRSSIPKIERLTQQVATRPNVASVWQRHQPETTPDRFA